MPYPVFLQLTGKLCVVVGAGKVATRRVKGLCKAGARVRVIGMDVGESLLELSHKKQIELHQRAFEASDLNDCFLVVTATDDEGVNRQVQVLANEQGILFCGADHTTQSDFSVPAVVTHGDLQVAISTGGHSPAYAKLLREDFESWLGEDHVEFLNLLTELRPRVFAQFPEEPDKRRKFWQHLVTFENLALARQGRWDAIKERIDSWLSS